MIYNDNIYNFTERNSVKKMLSFLFMALCLISCAGWKKKSTPLPEKKIISEAEVGVGNNQNPSPNNSALDDQVFRVKLIKSCDDCILGSYSVPQDSNTILLDSDKGLYLLAGADELELKNHYFDIPVIYNRSTKTWIEYFITRGRKNLTQYLELSGRYAPVMGHMLEELGMPRDLIFLAMAESGFQNNAKSKARAVGPWQFIGATGRKYNLHIDWYVDERRDPIKATIAAGSYLKELKELFGSWELAAAAYNAGEGKIARAIKKYGTDDFWNIRNRPYLRRETRNYVPKIMALAIIGKNLSSFGFDSVQFQQPLEYEIVKVPPLTDLKLVADKINLEVDELYRWNPELLRWFTPPLQEYNLRLPVGIRQKLANIDWKQFEAQNFQIYHAKTKMSLSKIAQYHHVPLDVLASINKLDPGFLVSKGTEVKLPFREGQDRSDHMYADLFDNNRRGSRSGHKRERLQDYIHEVGKKGQIQFMRTDFYTVKKGDTLWDVSKKVGVPLEKLIRGNLSAVEDGLRPGEKLAIR